MSHEREQTRAQRSADHIDLDHEATPARGTKSSQLDAPANPITSGLIQRKAHGDNGVAGDAETAVATASSSSGSSLPGTLMRKFESSLGTDLSSVRVHTGSASQAAASAVGAKAYAVGQDIHFGAGHYDPSSQGGQHLLAHEVAHTVQQRGGSPTRQNKLEVSAPHDAAEHEADRAADAMVAGHGATISGHAPAVHRKPDPAHTITIPTVTITDAPTPEYDGRHVVNPTYYAIDDGDGPDSIVAPWTAKPAFSQLMPQHGSGETFDSLAKSMAAFQAVWSTVQGAWNRAAPIGKRYADAQLDAEAKGLADFGKQPGELTQSITDLRFSTHTKVFDAFDAANNVLKPGQSNFDGMKVSKETKAEVATAKKAVADADRAIEIQNLDLKSAQNDLSSSKLLLSNAVRALDQLEIDKKIEPNQRMADAYKKCSDLCAASIGAMGNLTTDGAGGANAAGVGAVGIINTLYWDSRIHEVESQIQYLHGMKVANDVNSAKAAIDVATNSMETAKNKLLQALIKYNQNVADRAAKYRDLAAKLEKAGQQSGLSAKDAEKVSLAVQAKPVMELALSTCKEMYAALPDSLPPSEPDAERGCTLASNREDMVQRYGTLKTSKRVMGTQVRTWTQKLASVDKLVNAAHD